MTPESLQQLERRKIVAERYLRGQTQWQIARSLEIGQSTVSKDLAAIRKEWLAAAIADFDERKSEELAKIDLMEREYLAAWERSKSERQTTRTRRRIKPRHADGSTDAEDEAELRKEQRDGNPRFLDGALKCVRQRCELLGLVQSGTSVNVNVNTTSVIGGIDLDVVTGRKRLDEPSSN